MHPRRRAQRARIEPGDACSPTSPRAGRPGGSRHYRASGRHAGPDAPCSARRAKPLTRAQLAPLLAEQFPGYDASSLSNAVSYLVPTVQVTPRGLVTRLLPQLVTFRSDSGRQLFDLQDAPLPDPDTPAPVRFLPEYDNLLLSHADRSRIIPDGRKVPLPPGNGALMGTVLIDGFYRGDWKLGVDGDIATLSLTPFARLPVAIRTMSRVKASLCWRFWRRGPNAVG